MLGAHYVADNIGISGFKYVLGMQVSKLRRFVWLLVILLASAWMIWNIQGRVSYFLSRPSAITTQMKFKDKLMFPKVTICNQNTFRSSKVYDENNGPRTSPTLYEAIDRYLQVLRDDVGNQSFRQDVITTYGRTLSDKNTTEFYRRVAHNKTTLFQRCVWNGRQCGPENFTEVLTDMGVCYQFNDGMIVDKANKDGGLRLMLFVEQYDYMRDPRTSAGALVVISHHNETDALAKEHGIVVNVGHSVSIAVQKSEVTELPHPYGECARAELENYPDDVPYTYQRCHLNCLTSFIKRKCGCVSIFMPGPDTPICTLQRNLECVTPNEELFYQTSEINTCNCPSPCNSASYSPSMSIVPFSDSFKQSLALEKSSVSLSDVKRAVIIQAWGLLNTINPHVTDSIAHTSTLFIDFRNTWYSYSSSMADVVAEVQYLMKLVAENDFIESLVLELEPETDDVDFVWKILLEHDSRGIEKCVAESNEQLSKFVSQDTDNADLEETLVKHILIDDYLYNNVPFLYIDINSCVTRFLESHDIFLRFKMAASAKLKTFNISTWNSSALTPDTVDLVSHLDDITRRFFNRTMNLHEEYMHEMFIVDDIAKQPYYSYSSAFYTDNVLKLDIYFKDLGVQESKKMPAYSIEGLVCDIGGSIGLCLGGSILTLFEFFDIIAILCTSRKKILIDTELPEKKDAG